MVKVFSHPHTSFEIYEPKFPEKIDFVAKFQPKTVSKILSGMNLLKNPFPFYEESINKELCTIESSANLFTFPEMVQPCLKSAQNHHLRNQL